MTTEQQNGLDFLTSIENLDADINTETPPADPPHADISPLAGVVELESGVITTSEALSDEDVTLFGTDVVVASEAIGGVDPELKEDDLLMQVQTGSLHPMTLSMLQNIFSVDTAEDGSRYMSIWLCGHPFVGPNINQLSAIETLVDMLGPDDHIEIYNDNNLFQVADILSLCHAIKQSPARSKLTVGCDGVGLMSMMLLTVVDDIETSPLSLIRLVPASCYRAFTNSRGVHAGTTTHEATKRQLTKIMDTLVDRKVLTMEERNLILEDGKPVQLHGDVLVARFKDRA